MIAKREGWMHSCLPFFLMLLVTIASFPLGALGGPGASRDSQLDTPLQMNLNNAPPTSLRQFPDTTRGIHVFTDQLATSMSDGQWRFAATHYAGTQKMLRADADRLRALNPSFVILHYRLGVGLGYRMPDSGCQPVGDWLSIVEGNDWVHEYPNTAQESWFYHYPEENASRVYNCDWGWYLMNLDDDGWRNYWQGEVLRQIQANDDDGVFMDSLSVPNYMGYDHFEPSLPAVDERFESAWSERISGWLSWLQTQPVGDYYIVPNAGSWINSRDRTDYSAADGVMVEGFAIEADRSPYAYSDWQLQMTRVLELVSQDKLIIGQSYATGDQERMFAIGSYLLVKGGRTFVTIETGEEPEWYPEYDIPIGAPIENAGSDIANLYEASNGVYRRDFDNGFVLVNPQDTGGATATVDLGGTYYLAQASGGGLVPSSGISTGRIDYEAVTRVSLSPYWAAVVLNTMPAQTSTATLTSTQSGNLTYSLGALHEKIPDTSRVTPKSLARTLATHFDWRDYAGQNWMTPVKNQGSCGSCVAFGSVAAVEGQFKIQANNPAWDIDLSEAHLFSCGGGSCDSGWWVSSALNYLQTYGTPDEACSPYRAGSLACSNSCPNWQSRAFRITGWNWIAANPSSIEAALQSGPLVATFDVYTDFFYYSGGIYSHTWGGLEGGHAVTIVGYDSAEQYWIVKNSWGTGWGESGYFRIAFGQVGIEQEVAAVRASVVTATTTVALPQTSTTQAYATTTWTRTSYTSTSTLTSTVPTVTTVALLLSTVTSAVQSIQYLTSILTTTLTSYTGTSTSTSTVSTTVALVPLTMTSTAQSTQYLTITDTATVTSYTDTEMSTSTIPTATTVALVPLRMTPTVQSTQYLTSILTATVTSYTSTQTSTSTIPTVTTVVLLPSTVTSTVQSAQYLTSTATTTVTSYTATTTSTSISVVYTTVTSLSGVGASSPLAYLGFASLFAVTVGRVTLGKGRRIQKVLSHAIRSSRS